MWHKQHSLHSSSQLTELRDSYLRLYLGKFGRTGLELYEGQYVVDLFFYRVGLSRNTEHFRPIYVRACVRASVRACVRVYCVLVFSTAPISFNLL